MKNIFNTYSRHLIKKSFVISAMVWTVMVFLDFSVTLVLELENISAEKGFITIFSVLLYEQPTKGMQYLESSMLIGTLIALSIFNKQGNLVFLRSAGFSPIKIVLVSGLGPIIFSFMLIFFDEILFLDLSKKSKLLNQPFYTSEEVQWEITDKNLIGLKRINEREVQAIQVVEFDNQQRISSSKNYFEGNIENGKLLITDPTTQKIFDFPSSSFLSSNALENFSLYSLLSLRKTYLPDDDLQKINSLIYAKVFLPISIIAIIFLAGSLMFDSTRSSGVGRQIILGISIGFIYDLIKDLSIASFLTYQLPMVIAYLLPITILIGIGAYRFQKI
tara:strand:+ start:269 stop:1264 length:996 start_codon:yes stop_codon:yes gene_type:complete